MNHWTETFMLLVAMHALTDYALQSMAMESRKDPKQPSPEYVGPWWWTMLAHSLINGLGVWMITGSVQLLIAETLIHGLLDTGKCFGFIGTKTDQAGHVICKAVWALV